MQGGNVSDDRYSHREEILEAARDAVLKQRNNTYGPPTQDFDRASAILNALGYQGPGDRDLSPRDIAVMQIAVKLSRVTWNPTHTDSCVDIAGYAACGYECAIDEFGVAS
jgi:hypothetical protein